jgi:hypothetical protein
MAIKRTYFRERIAGVSRTEIFLVQLNRNLNWKVCIKDGIVRYAERHIYSFYDVRHRIVAISGGELPMYVWSEIDKFNRGVHNSKLYKPEKEKCWW